MAIDRLVRERMEYIIAHEDVINPKTKKKYEKKDVARKLGIVVGTLYNYRHRFPVEYEEIRANFDIRSFRERAIEIRIVDVGNRLLDNLEEAITDGNFNNYADVSQVFKQLGSVIKDISEARHKREETKGEVYMLDTQKKSKKKDNSTIRAKRG